ncbi:hypothetical protein [Methanobrevibacter sp.]
MSEDIAENIELGPIIKGVVVALILIVIGWYTSGYIGLFGLIAGSAISGFSTNNSTKYALIYGAIVGLICSFTMLTVFTIPIFIILGLFGGFVGKVIQSNIE